MTQQNTLKEYINGIGVIWYDIVSKSPGISEYYFLEANNDIYAPEEDEPVILNSPKILSPSELRSLYNNSFITYKNSDQTFVVLLQDNKINITPYNFSINLETVIYGPAGTIADCVSFIELYCELYNYTLVRESEYNFLLVK